MRLLEPDETLLWSGKPDPLTAIRSRRALWIVALVLLAAALTAYFLGWIDGETLLPLLMPSVALFAAPILMAIFSEGTVYGITGKRAIIDYDMFGYANTHRVNFEDMDEKLEILPVGTSGAGHLYFASGYKIKSPYIDYTGRLAFRELKDAGAAAAALEQARAQWKNKKL